MNPDPLNPDPPWHGKPVGRHSCRRSRHQFTTKRRPAKPDALQHSDHILFSTRSRPARTIIVSRVQSRRSPMRLASFTTLLAALAFALASGGLDAQAKKVGKMYKWTDKEGNVHYSDQIPPEAVEYGREKFNDQGMAVEKVERALTPEELAVQREAERLAAEEARRAEEQKKQDETLIASYASEEDLVRAYDQRMDLLDQTIEARRIEISAREQSLSKLVAQAADLERGGRPVSDALRQMITSEQNEISRQRSFLENKDKERTQIKADHERQLARFREAMARSKGQ